MQVQPPLVTRDGRTTSGPGLHSGVFTGGGQSVCALLLACLAPGLSGRAAGGPGAYPEPGGTRRPQPSWATCPGTGPFMAMSQKPHGTRNLHET